MTIRTKNGRYQCFYCKKIYDRIDEAHACRESHDLIYIPMSKSDVNKLLHFIMIPNEKLLEDTPIVEFLQKALRRKNEQ